MLEIRNVSDNKKGMRDFIDLPYRIYRDDPHWVAPLRIERKIFFDRKKNPFFEHGEADYFVAYRDDRPVGRITAHIDHNYDAYYQTKHGFFGFFEVDNDPEAADALIVEAERWVAAKGVHRIIGPMNFTTNHDTPGFLVEGFDTPPFLMMGHTRGNYPSYVEKRGYGQEQVLLAYILRDVKNTPPAISEPNDRIMRKFGDRISIRHFDIGKMSRELDIILPIYNDAWCKNWGYVAMTEKEIANMAAELKLVADSRLTHIVYKDEEPVAFLVGIPDINQILIKNRNGSVFHPSLLNMISIGHGRKRGIDRFRVLLMGVLRKYRLLGLDSLLYYRIFEDALSAGYSSVEMSWILEKNLPMNSALIRMGAKPYKKYIVYAKEIIEKS